MASASDKVKKRPNVDSNDLRRKHNKELALALGRAGLHVFPSSGKVPLAIRWQHSDKRYYTADLAEAERVIERAKKAEKGEAYEERMNVGSTTNPDVIKSMWRNFPDAVPSISLGPSELYVADADIDDARHGPKLLAAFLEEHNIDISACPITQTRGGGRHIYFKGPGLRSHVGPTMDALYVQIKAQGGQTIAPGAWRDDGKRYVPIEGHPGLMSAFASDELPAVPEALVALQSEAGDRSSASDAELAPILTALREADLDAEAKYVTHDFVEGDGGNDRSAFRLSVANRLCERDRNATVVDYARALISDPDRAGVYVDSSKPDEGEFDDRGVAREWAKAVQRRDERDAREARLGKAFGVALDDPLQDALADFRKSIEAGAPDGGQAVLHALREAGVTTADPVAALIQAVSDPLDDRKDADLLDAIETAALQAVEPVAVETKTKDKAKSGERLRSLEIPHDQIEYPRWTIVDMLPERGVGFLNGASQTGKSFCAVDLMCSIAQGGSFLGEKIIEPRCCLYICAEDADDAPMRCRAWADVHGTFHNRVRMMERPPNLFADPKAIDRVVAAVAMLEAETGLKCALLTIDTIPRACPGMRENESADVNVLIDRLQKISDRAGVAVLGIRHPKKGDVTAEGRGSQAFYDGARFEFRLAGAGNLGRSMFQITKLKMGRTDLRGRPAGLDVVEVGRNVQGIAVTTCVFKAKDRTAAFEAAEDDELIEERDKLSAEHRAVFDIAVATIDANGGTASPATIVAAVQRASTDAKADTIRKVLANRLRRAGLLDRAGENYRRPERHEIAEDAHFDAV